MRAFLISFFALTFELLQGQTIALNYDANGNRVSKVRESTYPLAFFTIENVELGEVHWYCQNSAVLLEANGGDYPEELTL